MKRFFLVAEHSTFMSAALLLVRLVAGLAFVLHGWDKMRNPLGWMGPDAFAPPMFQALAAIAEFGGGLGWLAGLLTPLASFGILCTMTVAAASMTFKFGAPFVSPTGGASSELALVYWSLAVLFIVVGPGRFSADGLVFGSRARA